MLKLIGGAVVVVGAIVIGAKFVSRRWDRAERKTVETLAGQGSRGDTAE